MILMYHNSVPENAPKGYMQQSITLRTDAIEAQLSLLSHLYSWLPLDAYTDYYIKHGKAPARALCMTIDDGTEITFDQLYPVLTALNIPTTIFANSCQFNRGPLIWAAYINCICFEEHYSSVSFERVSCSLMDIPSRHQAKIALIRAAEASGDPVGFTDEMAKYYPVPGEILDYYCGLTNEQLQLAAGNPLFRIEAHTHSHYSLSTLSRQRAKEEISLNMDIIRSKTGKRVEYLSYPNGDYSEQVINICQELGIKAAYAGNPLGLGHRAFEIPRVGVFSAGRLRLLAKLFKTNFA